MNPSLDSGALIRRVLGLYVDQASVLMPAAAVVFVFTGILNTLLVAAAPALALLSLVISLVATTLFTGMIVELVADLQDGRRDATVAGPAPSRPGGPRRARPGGGRRRRGGRLRLPADHRPRPDPDHRLVRGRPGRGAGAPRRLAGAQ